MSFEFDFGFENPGTSWNEAYLALLFASEIKEKQLGKAQGPTAIAESSRYVELFEMQKGLSPLDIGVYAEVVNGKNPVGQAAKRAAEARTRGMVPVLIGKNRRITAEACTDNLVALWGKIGRKEAKESELFASHATILAGVRAATSNAFKSIPANVTIVTARALSTNHEIFNESLNKLNDPVHLSIDLDVLAPSAIQNDRSLEPGGLSWYDLMDAIESVVQGPGVASLDLTGTGTVEPRSLAGVIGAQIILKLAGLLAAGLEK